MDSLPTVATCGSTRCSSQSPSRSWMLRYASVPYPGIDTSRRSPPETQPSEIDDYPMKCTSRIQTEFKRALCLRQCIGILHRQRICCRQRRLYRWCMPTISSPIGKALRVLADVMCLSCTMHAYAHAPKYRAYRRESGRPKPRPPILHGPPGDADLSVMCDHMFIPS